MFDTDTGIVSDIQMAKLPESVLNGLGVLDKEIVRVNSKEYDLVNNEDDTYSAMVKDGDYIKHWR